MYFLIHQSLQALVIKVKQNTAKQNKTKQPSQADMTVK